MKKIYYIIIGVIFGFICLASFKISHAYSYKNNLMYVEDKEIMLKELNNYIDSIDNILIPTTSYTYSNILTENYDFLVRYAVNYIIDNKDIYKDNIIKKEDKKYISKEYIYEVTNKYFNITNFYIEEENILLEKVNKNFKLKIKNIEYEKDDYIKVNVLYENGVEYLYVFTYNQDNYMYLYNVEVQYESSN